MLFLQYATTGLMQGGVYALVALGFALLFKSTGILNFAQGQLVVIGASVMWTLVAQFGLPTWLGLMATFAFSILLGLMLERFVTRPMTGQPALALIMATIALSGILKGLVIVIWGPEIEVYPPFIPKIGLEMAGIKLSFQHLFCFGTSILLFILFAIFFQFTRSGLGMRAAAEDHQAARSSGISINTTFSLAWIISCIVSTIGGILLGSIIGVNYYLETLGMKAIAVVLLGGLESIPGALVGGLLMGVLEGISAGYIDPMVGGGFKEVFPFVVMIFILIIRPFGLFGLRRIERI